MNVLREKDELTGEVLERLQVELEALQDEFMQKQAMHEAEAAALHHKLHRAETTTQESLHGQDQLTAEALEHLQADLDALGALMLGISETYSTQTAQMKCQHAKDEAEKEQLNRQLESERNVSAALQVELAEFGKVPLADVVQSLQLLEDTSMTLLQEFDQVQQEMQKIPKQQQHGAEMDSFGRPNTSAASCEQISDRHSSS